MLICNASMDYLKSSIFVCFQANDGNWPILKQSSAPVVKPPQISNTDWKESSMDTALKQGTISSQPLPTSVLGSTDKLVGFICDIFIDLLCWNYEPLTFIAELTSSRYTFCFPAAVYFKSHKENYFCISSVCFWFYHIKMWGFVSSSVLCIPSCSFTYLISPLGFSESSPPPSCFSNSYLVSLFPLYRLLLFQCTLFLIKISKK